MLFYYHLICFILLLLNRPYQGCRNIQGFALIRAVLLYLHFKEIKKHSEVSELSLYTPLLNITSYCRASDPYSLSIIERLTTNGRLKAVLPGIDCIKQTERQPSTLENFKRITKISQLAHSVQFF